MKRTPRQRKAAQQRRRLAEQEARREEHARLVAERDGDPRFVQRHRNSDGSVVLSLDADADYGREIAAGLAAQQQAFRERYGCDPGPHDPLFFDPDRDEPTPLGEQQWEAHFDEMAAAATAAGLDPAYIHAWRDVGYIVTDANRHLFSASDVDAYLDAVARHQEDDDLGDAHDVDELSVVADGLRGIVAQTVEQGSAEPAWVLIRATDAAADPDAQQLLAVSGFSILIGWLAGARETFGADIAVPAVAWVRTRLGDQHAQTAMPFAAVLHHPDAPQLTVDQALDTVGDSALPALLWLAAGVVATALDGDTDRLRDFDPRMGPDDDDATDRVTPRP